MSTSPTNQIQKWQEASQYSDKIENRFIAIKVEEAKGRGPKVVGSTTVFIFLMLTIIYAAIFFGKPHHYVDVNGITQNTRAEDYTFGYAYSGVCGGLTLIALISNLAWYRFGDSHKARKAIENDDGTLFNQLIQRGRNETVTLKQKQLEELEKEPKKYEKRIDEKKQEIKKLVEAGGRIQLDIEEGPERK